MTAPPRPDSRRRRSRARRHRRSAREPAAPGRPADGRFPRAMLWTRSHDAKPAASPQENALAPPLRPISAPRRLHWQTAFPPARRARPAAPSSLTRAQAADTPRAGQRRRNPRRPPASAADDPALRAADRADSAPDSILPAGLASEIGDGRPPAAMETNRSPARTPSLPSEKAPQPPSPAARAATGAHCARPAEAARRCSGQRPGSPEYRRFPPPARRALLPSARFPRRSHPQRAYVPFPRRADAASPAGAYTSRAPAVPEGATLPRPNATEPALPLPPPESRKAAPRAPHTDRPPPAPATHSA